MSKRFYYDEFYEGIYDSEIEDYPSKVDICNMLNKQDDLIKQSDKQIEKLERIRQQKAIKELRMLSDECKGQLYYCDDYSEHDYLGDLITRDTVYAISEEKLDNYIEQRIKELKSKTMSDYVREKVLRIPITEEQEKEILAKYQVDSLWGLEGKISNFRYSTVNCFQHSPTQELFLDYMLEYCYGEDCEEFGRVRDLSDKEKAKYGPLFQELYEGFDLDKIRLVEFCWYNCCEAPDYYDMTKDSFYDEV